MEEIRALAAFSALSQETRLRIVRLLVIAGPKGMPAGAVGEALGGTSSSRLSFHLGHLEQAGLVQSRREGRQIIYSVVHAALADLIRFLMRDCCQNRPEVCALAVSPVPDCRDSVPEEGVP